MQMLQMWTCQKLFKVDKTSLVLRATICICKQFIFPSPIRCSESFESYQKCTHVDVLYGCMQHPSSC